MSNRIKRIIFNPELLPMMFEDGLTFKVTKGLPKEKLQFRGFSHDYTNNTIVVFVEHESFLEVEEGGVPPIMDLHFERINDVS